MPCPYFSSMATPGGPRSLLTGACEHPGAPRSSPCLPLPARHLQRGDAETCGLCGKGCLGLGLSPRWHCSGGSPRTESLKPASGRSCSLLPMGCSSSVRVCRWHRASSRGPGMGSVRLSGFALCAERSLPRAAGVQSVTWG